MKDLIYDTVGAVLGLFLWLLQVALWLIAGALILLGLFVWEPSAAPIVMSPVAFWLMLSFFLIAVSNR